MKHWPAFIICLLLLIPRCAVLAAESDSQTLSPYFLVEGDIQDIEHFPLKATAVEATINGVMADVKVTQTYANNGATAINASYVFPASTRAAVHGMRMTIGQEVIKAEIQTRRQAKQSFAQAKDAGQGASLLEQQRPNVFCMQVANIVPGELVTIELHYTELLIPEAGIYQFVYPTVTGPRYATMAEAEAPDDDLWIKTPYLPSDGRPSSPFNIRVTLAPGLPIQQMWCDTHNTDVNWESEAHAFTTLAADEVHPGDRDFILQYRLTGDAIHSGLMLFQGQNENFFMLMVQPPRRVRSEAVPAREYIFVVDVSGSMHGFPLNTAKILLRELIDGLRPQDSFNVILFAGGARVLSPHSLPAQPQHVSRALELIDRQQGGGGTELYRALEKGLALPHAAASARTMVVVTDGYIAAEKEVFLLISENLNQSNLFAFGIGTSVNRYLIEGLAKAGQGEPFVVTDPHVSAESARRFKAYVQAPLLTDVNVDFDTFEVYDMEPSVIGDLFAQRPLIISGKWRGRPEGTVRISGHTGDGPYERQFVVSPHIISPSSRALPFLWARTRLARLSDFSPYKDGESTRKQVTRLGLDYSLLTAYTSFVAVHESISNPYGPGEDVKQPLPLPRGVSNLALGGRNVPEPGLGMLLAAMAAAVAAVMLTRRHLNKQFPFNLI